MTGPVVVLWSRSIAYGTKALITALIIMIVLSIVMTISWNKAATQRTRNLVRSWWKLVKDIRTGRRSKMATTLSALCMLAILLVPLVIIWTQPITHGIKVAITVIICFVGFGVVVWYLIDKLVAAAIVDYGSVGGC